MTTMIPHTIYTQIVQTNSSPETIAALLNEAEEKYSSTPKHFNQKRVYPFWKICQVCLKPYQCHAREQAKRKKTCSKECNGKRISLSKKGKKLKPAWIYVCPWCNQEYDNWNKNKDRRFCSGKCYGEWKSTDPATVARLKTIASTGRNGWTEESYKTYQQNMSGANNPAWKGGVTYFKKHGNYQGVKYVRCPQELLSMSRKDGYVMEHRLIVAQAIGRPLLRVEAVHHIDHNPTNNSLNNLQLFASNQAHKLYEHRGTPLPIWSL